MVKILAKIFLEVSLWLDKDIKIFSVTEDLRQKIFIR